MVQSKGEKPMVDITALDGTVLHIDDNSVTIVSGPLPHDPPNRSYVTGPAPAVIETAEDAAHLVGRLPRKVALVKLTRPNNTPVWIKGAAVTLVKAPNTDDIPPGEHVGAVLYIGGHHQAVVEDVPAVRATVNAHGGNV
jgi:hypothetical protein